MSFLRGLTTTAAALLLLTGTAPVHGQDDSRPVTGGGISVPGWVGDVDADAKSEGQTIKDTKLSKTGNVLQVVTGPAASFWRSISSQPTRWCGSSKASNSSRN